jgi:hypothetical protein
MVDVNYPLLGRSSSTAVLAHRVGVAAERLHGLQRRAAGLRQPPQLDGGVGRPRRQQALRQSAMRVSNASNAVDWTCVDVSTKRFDNYPISLHLLSRMDSIVDSSVGGEGEHSVRSPGLKATSLGSQASAQTPRSWHHAVRVSGVALTSAHTMMERSADAVASHAALLCRHPPASSSRLAPWAP